MGLGKGRLSELLHRQKWSRDLGHGILPESLRKKSGRVWLEKSLTESKVAENRENGLISAIL